MTTSRPETRVRKGRDGWTATTIFELHEVEKGTRVLNVLTQKRSSGKLTTSVQGMVKEPSQNGFGVTTFKMYGDFHQTLNTSSGKVRVTEKAVADFHAEALCQMETVMPAAREFYREETCQDA